MTSRRKHHVLALSLAGIALLAVLAVGCGVDSREADSGPGVDTSTEAPSASGQVGRVQHADESNFGELVLGATGPVLVDFYADWCGPCQTQAPILDDFAREKPDLLIVKVDIDQAPGLAKQYAVNSIPHIKVFRQGQVVGQHVGVASKDELASLAGS